MLKGLLPELQLSLPGSTATVLHIVCTPDLPWGRLHWGHLLCGCLGLPDLRLSALGPPILVVPQTLPS